MSRRKQVGFIKTYSSKQLLLHDEPSEFSYFRLKGTRDDDEELTPSTGGAWEGRDIATGDPGPRLPAPGDAAISESAPVVRVAVGASAFERASAGDGAMWDGDLTPPPNDDAAPQAEMDGIDTEPIGEPGSGKEAHSDRKSSTAMDEPGQREEQP